LQPQTLTVILRQAVWGSHHIFTQLSVYKDSRLSLDLLPLVLFSTNGCFYFPECNKAVIRCLGSPALHGSLENDFCQKNFFVFLHSLVLPVIQCLSIVVASILSSFLIVSVGLLWY